MTQQEFTERTGVKVSAEEYAAIEVVYMNSDLEKDEFCKMWCKMNQSRVKAAKEEAKHIAKEEAAMETVWSLYDRLQQTGASIRPDLAIDFITNKEYNALIQLGISIWDFDCDCEKDTTMIYSEIIKLIDEKAA